MTKITEKKVIVVIYMTVVYLIRSTLYHHWYLPSPFWLVVGELAVDVWVVDPPQDGILFYIKKMDKRCHKKGGKNQVNTTNLKSTNLGFQDFHKSFKFHHLYHIHFLFLTVRHQPSMYVWLFLFWYFCSLYRNCDSLFSLLTIFLLTGHWWVGRYWTDCRSIARGHGFFKENKKRYIAIQLYNPLTTQLEQLLWHERWVVQFHN